MLSYLSVGEIGESKEWVFAKGGGLSLNWGGGLLSLKGLRTAAVDRALGSLCKPPASNDWETSFPAGAGGRGLSMPGGARGEAWWGRSRHSDALLCCGALARLVEQNNRQRGLCSPWAGHCSAATRVGFSFGVLNTFSWVGAQPKVNTK